MPDGSVKSLERERLKKHLATLAAGAAVNDADFADAIYQAQTQGVSAEALRDQFGLSGAAVERWMQGHNLPQPSIRAKILGWIVQQLE